jgi:KDO2-lipid IV(A) lauroyltransferase
MVDYFYLASYKTFSFFVKIMPQNLLDAVISSLASFAYFASKKRRDVIKANLNICFPQLNDREKKSIAKRSYRNLLHNISGFIKRQNQSKKEVLKNITFKNRKI